jgi:hypothetical protein
MRNPVSGAAVTNIGTLGMGNWNPVTFDPVTTTQLRLKMFKTTANGNMGLGEWEVFGAPAGTATPSVTITKAPSYTNYAIYDQLDLRGIEVKVDNGAGTVTTYGDADIPLLLTKVSMDYNLNSTNGLTSAAAGAQQTATRTVTLTFDGGSDSFLVNVSRYAFDNGQKLAVVTAPENPAGNGGNAEMRNFDSTFHSTFGAKTAVLGVDGKFVPDSRWTTVSGGFGHPVYTINRNTNVNSYFGYSVRPNNNGYLYLNNVASSYYTSPTTLTGGANYLWKFIRLANGRYAFVYMGNTNNYNLAMAQTNNVGNGATSRAYATFVEFNPATTNQWYDLVAEYTPDTETPFYSLSASPLASFGSVTGTPYTQPAAQTVTITNTGTGPIILNQPGSTNYNIGTLSTRDLSHTGDTATFTVQPKAGLAVGSYNETITINGSGGAAMIPVSTTVSASFTVNSGTIVDQPEVEEVRIISSNMIELHWKVHTKYTGNQAAYRYSDGHPDSLIGAGSSLNFSRNQTTDRNNFEIRLNGGAPLAQPASSTQSASPYYWHADNYLLHQVRMNQHVTTLRLSTALTTAQQTALANGTSTITVQIVGNVTNRAGTAADKTKVYTAIWKPYYDKQVVAKTGLTIKGSQFVDIRTVQKAADITDVIMSAMPEVVVRAISSQGAFLLFGPGEHSGNIPEQRVVISYDEFNRAEGYGGTNAATSAANVERCNVVVNGVTNNPVDYYPAGYRSGYQHESILAHEFGHKIQSAFNSVYGTTNPLRVEFNNCFSNVTSRGMWTPYVRDAGGGSEYFATMTSVWYNGMSEGNAANCNTRDEFFRYDRKGYDFFSKIFSVDKIILSPDWANCPNTAAPTWNTGSADPFATLQTRALLSAEVLDGISVPLGTAIGAITLPATAQVSFADSFTTLPWNWNLPFGLDRYPVTWDTSAYNGAVPGTYTIVGTPSATYTGRYLGGTYTTGAITNPNNVKASIAVTVESPAIVDAETPVITTMPDNVTVNVGAAVTFTVAATVSKGTLSYQWYSIPDGVALIPEADGDLIPGAIGASYSPPTNVPGIVWYYCKVTNTDNDATGQKTASAKHRPASVTVNAAPSDQPEIEEVRIINNNMIELHWKVLTKWTGNQAAYRYSDGHPDTLMGAGSSLNFNASQNNNYANFEVKLDGVVINQRTGTFSPYYWHADNYLLHQVRMNQHVSTLRLNSNLSAAQMTALENGASKITVQVVGNVTNRAGTAADKTKVYDAIWKPYYDKQVTAKTGLTIKGSQYVDMRTVQKAADITDVLMSAMPEEVVNRISTQGAFLLFGPGEHSGNIPEQRNVITYDQFNRAEGYGGTNAATSAANVERCNVVVNGVTNNPVDYYPAGYRTGYQHESILAHEFGHKIQSAFNSVYAANHPLRQEFTAAFANVTSRVMWTPYVRDASGGSEYFATMTSVWYNGMSEGNGANCNTRDEFFRYDRKGYDFFSKIFSVDKIILSPDWANCPNTAAPNWNTGSADPFATIQTRALADTPALPAITVPVGTAIGAITLPNTVKVSFDNSFSASLPSWTSAFGIDNYPVDWDTSAYNGKYAGTYVIEGTPHATYTGKYLGGTYTTGAIVNPDDVKATIEITVEGGVSFVPVTDIIDVPAAAIAGQPLTLTGTVVPADATFQTILWSLKDAGNTGATLSGDVLSTTATGTVVVTATIENGEMDTLDGGTDFVKDFTITVYNYGVYLVPNATTLTVGETFSVDVMLAGNINYTQIATEIAYDNSLLQFSGFENMQGFITACGPLGDDIAVRSVPSTNMITGAPCSAPVTVVTLKFTVKAGFSGDVKTVLSVPSAIVNPPAGYLGTTIAPGQSATVTLHEGPAPSAVMEMAALEDIVEVVEIEEIVVEIIEEIV